MTDNYELIDLRNGYYSKMQDPNPSSLNQPRCRWSLQKAVSSLSEKILQKISPKQKKQSPPFTHKRPQSASSKEETVLLIGQELSSILLQKIKELSQKRGTSERARQEQKSFSTERNDKFIKINIGGQTFYQPMNTVERYFMVTQEIISSLLQKTRERLSSNLEISQEQKSFCNQEQCSVSETNLEDEKLSIQEVARSVFQRHYHETQFQCEEDLVANEKAIMKLTSHIIDSIEKFVPQTDFFPSVIKRINMKIIYKRKRFFSCKITMKLEENQKETN